jgi:hypothetical protein
MISQITQFCPKLRISAIFPHLSEITTPELLGEQGCVNTYWKANEVTYNFGIVPFPWIHRERCQNRLHDNGQLKADFAQNLKLANSVRNLILNSFLSCPIV